jgi:hypothetical protein
MPKEHKSTEQKIAEINEILEPLNGEPLHIIPCLFFNEKTKHIFPYRIKFLLPQLFGYSESQQLVRIAYLNGSLRLKAETIEVGESFQTTKSFKPILLSKDFRPIKELLDPIQNKLLPQAETVLFPISCESYGPRHHSTRLDFVIKRYINYYQLLYSTYDSEVQDIFRKPNDYVQFHEFDLTEIDDSLIERNTICSLAEALKRDTMLERLTYGHINGNDRGKYKYYKLSAWSEWDIYRAAVERDSASIPGDSRESLWDMLKFNFLSPISDFFISHEEAISDYLGYAAEG